MHGTEDTQQRLVRLSENVDDFLTFVGETTRAIAKSDGATFVLRDDDYCYYAEENAIAPLWKGKRFHTRICISGWAMINKMPAIIDNIYLDTRIPMDAYRPTFVKSLAMVPVRKAAPIAAIGSYWASQNVASSETVRRLEDFAEHVAVALEQPALIGALRNRATAAA